MTDLSKIKSTHTQRAACVYIRQSTPSQVEYTVNPQRASMLCPREPASWAGQKSK
jgi:hypothetical protein